MLKITSDPLRIDMLIFLLLVLANLPVNAGASEPPVGFVCHYPFIDVGMEELPRSGASSLIVRAVMGEIEKEEGKFDFSTLDRQIAYAEGHGLNLVLLLECNPVYCPPWLREKCRTAGELQRYADGRDYTDPSINSRIFAKARDEFIQRVVEYVKQRDTKRVITHYNPGAEWWFIHATRYNPLDIEGFRKWIEDKYASIYNLNNAWQSDYKSFDEIIPPRMDLLDYGHMSGLSPILVDTRPQDCSWSTRQSLAPRVIPGKTYVFSAWIKTENVIGRGAHLSTSWLTDSSDIPFHMDYSPGVDGTHGWQKISMRIKAPKNASRVWLLLKLAGFGTAVFDNAEFCEEGTKENLLLNPGLNEGNETPDSWFFDNWVGEKSIKGEYLKTGGRDNSPCVRITIPYNPSDTLPYKNLDSVMYDWSQFWYETAAQYIQNFAAVVKKLDPSRKTATYLTYAFAFPVEWDYVQANAVCPDELSMRARDIDVIGMQICSADGDPFRVTANLDLVRKYGKPMWAIDLLDWTRGVAIGYETNNKVVQAAIQHGAQGIFHYCWHGTPDYNFYPDMDMTEMNRMLSEARKSLKIVEGMEVKPSMAIIQPILSASPTDNEGFKNDYRSFYGWYKILQGMHITLDVVTFRELQDRAVDLRKYDWVFVPDCAYIPSDVYIRLLKFVGWGGKLLTSGRFFQLEETGQTLKFDTKFLKSKVTTIPDYGKVYAGKMHRNTYAGNTPPLFIWRKETRETLKAFQSAKSALMKYSSTNGISSDVEIIPDDPSIHCVEWTRGTEKAVYLVNMKLQPAKGVRVRIRNSAITEPEVYIDSECVGVAPVQCEGEWLSVGIPEFRTSCIIKSRR